MVAMAADETHSDAEIRDELPEELNASGYVGPYVFPDNNRRRIPAVLYALIGAGCIVTYVAAGDDAVLVNRGVQAEHRQEPDDDHVRMCGSVDDPRRMRRHRHAKDDAGQEPQQRRADERLDEPFHGRKLAPILQRDGRWEMGELR